MFRKRERPAAAASKTTVRKEAIVGNQVFFGVNRRVPVVDRSARNGGDNRRRKLI